MIFDLSVSNNDLITCGFDLMFFYSGIQNIRALYRDKIVKGFDWRNMILFVSFNVWSIFVIYPSANLILANVLNVAFLCTQLTWIGMYLYYRKEISK